MCMWQSQAFSGAASFGRSVPLEFDTCWAWPCRPITDAVAAAAIMEAFLMNVRRSFTSIFMLISPGLEEWGTRGQTVKTRVFGLSFPHKEETMNKSIASHAVFGCATALIASFATWL